MSLDVSLKGQNYHDCCVYILYSENCFHQAVTG